MAFWPLFISMAPDMKDRIKKLMENQHMTQKIFAQFTGISEGTLSGIFNGRTRPTLQIVDNIHQHFPKISIDWLMFGNGPMYVSNSPTAAENAQQSDSAAGDSSTDNTAASNASHNGGELTTGNQTSAGAGSGLQQPSLFGQDNGKGSQSARSAASQASQAEKVIVKYVDKPQRKITEIRIFYDDQTWESFVPKK